MFRNLVCSDLCKLLAVNTLPIMNLQPRMQPVGESFMLNIWYKKSRPGSCLDPIHITSCKITQEYLQCTEHHLLLLAFCGGLLLSTIVSKWEFSTLKRRQTELCKHSATCLERSQLWNILWIFLVFPYGSSVKIRQQLRDSSCEIQSNFEDYKFF